MLKSRLTRTLCAWDTTVLLGGKSVKNEQTGRLGNYLQGGKILELDFLFSRILLELQLSPKQLH